MARLIVFIAIMGAAWYALDGAGFAFDPRGVGTRVEGREVIREAGDIEARFRTVGAVDDAYMLFGGAETRQRNSLSHAVMAGLPMHHARAIAREYPDFHLCKSPGAEPAKRFTEQLTLVAADRSARDTLGRALELFEERLHGSGERTCIELTGAPLALESVRLVENDADLLQGDLKAAYERNRFVLAKRVELADCPTLLR